MGKFFDVQRFAKKISLTGGDDWMWNSDSNVVIYALGGNDHVINDSERVSIIGGDGVDTIANSAARVAISGNKGNDLITLESTSSRNVIKYSLGDGDDVIRGFNSDDTLHIIKGTYTVKMQDTNIVVIVGGDSIILEDVVNVPIKIKSASGAVKIFTNKFNKISNSDSDKLISGQKTNSGKDAIYNSGDNVTITSGRGADSICNLGDNILIRAEKDNDKIVSGASTGSKAYYVTLDGGSGNDRIKNYGYYASIIGGTGNDTIYNDHARDVTITGGAGNDSIYNESGYDVIMDCGIGDDTVETWFGSGTINGGKGDDYIAASNSYELIGGEGDDTIYGSYAKKIEGDTGNDYIDCYNSGYGNTTTIKGGKGNDTITLGSSSGCILQYASGDNIDTILGFDSTDTLHITKGSYKAKVSGNDVIITVGKGKITLKDVAGQEISIKNSKGKVTTKTYGSASSALFAENNFATADNLSEIVAEKSVGEVQFTKPEKISQENLIVYATK